MIPPVNRDNRDIPCKVCRVLYPPRLLNKKGICLVCSKDSEGHPMERFWF